MLPVSSEEAWPAGSASTSGGVSTQRDEDAALALYETLRAGGVPSGASGGGPDGGPGGRGWRRLHELGLVQVRDGIAEAIDPDAALARAMDHYQANAAEQLRSGVRLQRVTDALLSVYRPAVQRETSEVAVEFIADPRRKQRTRLDLSDAAREVCASMHPGPMPSIEVLEASLEHDRTIMARGVHSRAIYPISCMQSPKYARYLHALADAGVDLRLVDHVPFDMLTFDGVSAVLAADPERPSDSVIVIRGTALMRSFTAVYEDCWLRGLTLARASATSAEDSEITSQERIIIRLMADGLSDDQIARKLGVHRRTVQRAVAKLMERLNATSRFEAGLKLANDAEFAKTFVVQ